MIIEVSYFSETPTTSIHNSNLAQSTSVTVTVPPRQQTWNPISKRLYVKRDKVDVGFPVSLQIFQQGFRFENWSTMMFSESILA